MTNFWHPMADMAAVAEDGEFVVTKGDGVRVWDDHGQRYLDASGGLWYCNVGYGRQEIVDAVARQLSELPAYSAFGDFANRPVLDLADRLATLAPVPGSVSFFTSGGSDSVDTGVKLARHYWQVRGRPNKSEIVTRGQAYHGMHLAGTSLAGIDANRTGYGELLPNVSTVDRDDPAALAKRIDEVGPDRVAAFFCEPVIGAGGIHLPPEGYLNEVRRVCRERDVLFVADEVITGFGRLGAWFASGRFDLEPDLILCAKGLTSGYLPMGAVIAAPQVAEPFWSQRGRTWRHGYTYSGHATVAAAALANLDIMEREDIPGRAAETEPALAAGLRPLTDHPLVSEVRAGLGVLAAVQIDPAAQEDRPSLAGEVLAALRRHGVVTRAIAGGAIQISPSLIFEEAHIQELYEAFGKALDDCAA